MKITLPRKVLMINNNLQLHGFEAFAVGGLRKRFHSGQAPGRLGYYHIRPAGGNQETVPKNCGYGDRAWNCHCLIGKDSFEVTTYRVDGAYEDSRHPTEVRFTSRLEDDLQRPGFYDQCHGVQ